MIRVQCEYASKYKFAKLISLHHNDMSVILWEPSPPCCKSLPFFYFLTFDKGRLLYIHPVGWLVGRLVGWSVGR